MGWPDDRGPRFIVDTHPTVRVLDRAYCHKVVALGSLRFVRWHAAVLNAEDDATETAA